VLKCDLESGVWSKKVDVWEECNLDVHEWRKNVEVWEGFLKQLVGATGLMNGVIISDALVSRIKAIFREGASSVLRFHEFSFHYIHALHIPKKKSFICLAITLRTLRTPPPPYFFIDPVAT
jgi:hypothetical protein